MNKLQQLEQFLLDKTKPHCEIDTFYLDRLMEYSTMCGENGETPTYRGYREYIHSFIDTELGAIWFEIDDKIKGE